MAGDSEQSAPRIGLESAVVGRGSNHGREVRAEHIAALMWGVGSGVGTIGGRREKLSGVKRIGCLGSKPFQITTREGGLDA